MVDCLCVRSLRRAYSGGNAAVLDAPGLCVHRRRAGTVFYSAYAGSSAGPAQSAPYLGTMRPAGAYIRRFYRPDSCGNVPDQGRAGAVGKAGQEKEPGLSENGEYPERMNTDIRIRRKL